MAEKFDLIADYREDTGKGASRRLRREGRVPAIIYGAGRPPRSLSFDHNKVLRQLENESFYSSVLNIRVGDKSQAAIVKDIQRHPAKPQVLHMDFQRIVEDEEIRMNVPIHFVGEKQARPRREGARDCHALLLPAGKRARIMAEPIAETDPLQQGARALVGPAFAGQFEWQHDVLERRHLRQQLERLEHEAEIARPPGSPGILAEFQNLLAEDRHTAGRRKVEAGQQTE